MSLDNDQIDIGMFLPTTDVYDTEAIYALDINSDEFKEFLVRLRQSINSQALVINLKTSGIYDLTEFVDGNAWFSTQPPIEERQFRQEYRKVVNFGTLPNNATKLVAHGIPVTTNTTLVDIYGSATNPNTGGSGFRLIPLNYIAPAGGANISLDMDDTNVRVTTTGNYSNFTRTLIVIEYLQTL